MHLAALSTAPDVPVPVPTFPPTVTDVDGYTVHVADLVREKTVVVVTLKATWCPVCQEQLVRLREALARINTSRVTFLVLSPGPRKELQAIRERTDFPYPFIEDQQLRIARSLGLAIDDTQISPCIFILDRDRTIRWLQRGRNDRYYGDGELLEQIGQARWI